MPRELDNWLFTYRDWTLPRSEAPESLIVWAGLYTLASVAKRHVYFPKSLMGSYSIYPNLYIIFVGPAGVVRKSTSAGYAEDLLKEISDVSLSSTSTSDSQLVGDLSDIPDGAMSIVSSEFATFINVSAEKMYDLLTDLYDGKLSYEYSTRTHGVELVSEPCLNLLAATTPTWVSNQMPAHVIGGGFTSRVIFVYENKVRQRRLYYDLDWDHFEKLRAGLVRDLIHIGQLHGKFRHDHIDTKNAMETWYVETSALGSGDEKIEGYFNRKHVHVHKVAMLLSLAERDDLIIDMTHFEAAKMILAGTETKMPRVFSAVGKNPFSADLEGVLDFIGGRTEPVERGALMRRFYHNLPADKLGEILAALMSMEEIEIAHSVNGKPSKTTYRLTTRGGD